MYCKDKAVSDELGTLRENVQAKSVTGEKVIGMYEGVKNNGKIDPDFEFGWFLETVVLRCDGLEVKAKEVLRGMFNGVLRYVTGYKWLEEPPELMDLTGVFVTAEVVQNEQGKNHNEILGSWDIIFTFKKSVSDADKTSRATLFNIENAMERFVRARYNIEEPKDLTYFVLEQQRNNLVTKHFMGVQ